MRKTLAALGRKHLCTILGLTVILAVSIVVFRNWIFSSQWPAGGDVLGFVSREYIYARDNRWLFVWRPNSFGYPEAINPLDFFFLLVHPIAGNAINTAKIFGISLFALAGFAMYVFGYHFSRKHLPALAGSLIYILNGQYLTQLTEAHLDIMLGYAVAPIIFVFLDRALENGKMRDVAATSILMGIVMIAFQPQMIFIYGFFLGLFIIAVVLRPQGSLRLSKSVKIRLKRVGIICVFAAALSAFFWAPFLFNVRAPYLSSTFSRGNLEDAYANAYGTFYEAFALTGKEYWGYVNVVDVTKEASLQVLPVPTILLIVFAFAYVITLIFKCNRYTLFFALAALLSIVIAMGPYAFESSFVWAWSNVPYFQSFRAISRWNMMTALSNSFFVCIAASILVGYIQRRWHKPDDAMEVEVRIRSSMSESRSLRVSLPDFGNLSQFVKRLLPYFAIFALVVILLSGFFSTWFLFGKGLQVYAPPSAYIQPYEYLSNIPGEFKIIPVTRSLADWYSPRGEHMDFAYGSMLTSVGWGHDIGYESTFIHDRPTLQDGGLSAGFVNYMRYLAANNITRNLLKLVGAFNFKYIVIPPYATEDVRDFFTLQYGGQMVYNKSSSIILENEFYNPRIFGSTESALVIGSVESLSSLCDVDSFDFGKTAVVLATQADEFSAFSNYLNNSGVLVFANVDNLDLIMRMKSGDFNLVSLGDYGMRSWNDSVYWIKNDWWTNTGASVIGGSTLSTRGNNKINIPIELKTGGEYDVLIRAVFAPNRGELLVSIDGLPMAEVLPYHPNFAAGLRWINVTSNYHFEAGNHVITLSNDGTGNNDLDAIAVIEHSELKSRSEEITNILQSFAGRVLYLIEAESAFSTEHFEGWSVPMISGQGYALHVEGGINTATRGLASASSVADLEAKNAIDGDYLTRWASRTDMPQWLEVKFSAPEEIRGVGVKFEAAYAQNYQIQTWNGTDWVDQIVVEDNNSLDREHIFSQSVISEKLRIHVTSAPAYNMVSIWELQIFSDSGAPSSEIFVPRNGEYSFAVRFFRDSDSDGTFYLRVDDELFSVACTSVENRTAWVELGSAWLDAGEHRISVFTSGSVNLDKIGIYSALDGESTIDGVFKYDASAPSVSYEKVNPCKYVVHISCERPFLLVFSESYHPLWKAYMGNIEMAPVSVNSLANGFFINRSGSFDVVIRFVGQDVADVGLWISVCSFILIIAIVVVKSSLAKKVKHFMMRRA